MKFRNNRPWQAILVGAACLLLTVFLYMCMQQWEEERLHNLTRNAALHAGSRVTREIKAYKTALALLSEDWQNTQRSEQENRVRQAQRYIRSLRGMRQIFWLDNQSQIRWMAAAPDQSGKMPDSLIINAELTELLRKAQEKGSVAIAHVPEQHEKNPRFFVAAPFAISGTGDGWILAEFESTEVFTNLLGDLAGLGFAFIVKEDGTEVFRLGEKDDSLSYNVREKGEVKPDGVTWKVVAWPSRELLATLGSVLPEAVLLLGVAFSVLLASLIHFSRKSSWNLRRQQQANQALQVEMVQRDRLSRALADSEERYRRFFEEGLSGNYISTADGKILYCNRSFAHIFGFQSADDALHYDIKQLYPRSESRENFIRLLQENKRLEYHEMEMRNLNGAPVIVLENCTGVFDDDGRLMRIRGYIFDITEKRRLEEQFRQAQKMEAVGRLAGGIAHDFNNILTVIQGYTQLLMDAVDDDDALRADVRQISVAAERAAILTTQLLAFSRRQLLQPVVLNINEVVGEIAKMVQRIIGEDIDFHTILDPHLGNTLCDRSQLEQIILNLTVNARDAMPDGGKLTLETANVALSEEYTRTHAPVKAGQYVMVSVTDTGIGMDEVTIEQIFEPFFTTKEPGKGTGLGLATVYGIVKQSGGYIWVYSEPGVGTTFKVYFPRVEAHAEQEQPAPAASSSLHGSETILVVEDEEQVRQLTVDVLESYGYRVLAAASPTEAINIARHHSGAIDLVLTDVVLPAMNGRKLVERLEKISPGFQALYVSGYTDNAIIHQGILEAGTAFVQKPYSPRVLAAKVREVLDAQQR